MGLINYIKEKLFSGTNDEPQYQPNVCKKAESSPKETVINQEPAHQYADSSGIPNEEKQFYREDEYYTLMTWNNELVITFEERKKTCIPSAGGLYVAEILLLEYCKKNKYPPSIKSGYPGFWWFQYGLRDVGGTLRSLENRGFILINKDTGKYTLTPKGKHELEENEYIPYMHRNNFHDLDVWKLNHLLNDKNKKNWRTFISQDFEYQNRKRIPVVINGLSCELEFPYVSLSTSGDERVCKMCKQFEGKLLRVEDGPQLPLHPMCGCNYQKWTVFIYV